ncbi:MAG: hypothetical protein HY315_03535 [Acidobacteria bacterium]|nr:hypothetical protein [Acidobacteriota bacterium]
MTLHRLFIKTAVTYLLLGTALGGFLLINKGWFQIEVSHEFITVHNHMISVGFIMMMIMGVAYWMFPRPAGQALRDVARDRLAWANYFLLNAGLILRVIFEPFSGAESAARLLVASSLLQMFGIFLFVLSIWKRIRFPVAK